MKGLKVLLVSIMIVSTFALFNGNLSAWEGEVAVPGGSWMLGNGVDVKLNGGNSYDTYYQCIEIAQKRLYPKMGWPTVYASGNGGAAYIPEGSPGLRRYSPGSGYIPVPGDLIIEYPTAINKFGHVAIVDYTDELTGVIYAVEQNGPEYKRGRTQYFYNGSYYRGGTANASIKAIMHAPQNVFKNPTNGLTVTSGVDIAMPYEKNGKLSILSFGSNANGTFKSWLNTDYSDIGFMKDRTNKTLGSFADITGDGVEDFVIPYPKNGTLSLLSFVASGDGKYNPWKNTDYKDIGYFQDSFGRSTGSFIDITGDGKADYVIPYNKNGKLSILSFVSKGDGTFAPWKNKDYVDIGYMEDLKARPSGSFADVTGDGKGDYALPYNKSGMLSVLVFPASGDGTFTFWKNTDYKDIGYFKDVDNRSTGTFVDVTGDRKVDLVIPYNKNGKLSILSFVSKGDGTFNPWKNKDYFDIGYMEDLKARPLGSFADITGDGRSDYALPYNKGGKLSLLTFPSTSTGDFTYWKNTDYTDIGYFKDAEGRSLGNFIDVNGDRRADFSTPYNKNGNLSVLVMRANTDGTYGQWVNTDFTNIGYLVNTIDKPFTFYANVQR